MKTTPTRRVGTMSHVIAVWILTGWAVASALATPLLRALCRVTARGDRPRARITPRCGARVRRPRSRRDHALS
jgi:hypothetical protein